MPRLHHITDTRQVCEYPDSAISKVLTVLKWQMMTTFNRNEVHISHFFLQCQCYCQFWKSFNPDYIQISKIFTGLTDRLTDRLTHDKTDCLKPLCACAQGVLINHYPFLIFIKLQKASTYTLNIKNSH